MWKVNMDEILSIVCLLFQDIVNKSIYVECDHLVARFVPRVVVWFLEGICGDQFVKMGRFWRETRLCLFPYHTEGNASSEYFTDICVHTASLRFSTCPGG